MPPDSIDVVFGEQPLTPAKSEPFWNYTDVALVFGLLLVSIAFILAGVTAAVALRPALKSDPTPILLPTQLALYGFLYLCLYLVLNLRYRKPVLSSLGWRPSHFNLLWTLGGGLLLALSVSALASVLHTPEVPSPLAGLTKSPLMLTLVGIMAITLAPFFEELLFRGFLQPLLSKTFGAIVGILLTAAIFGGLHAPEYSYAWQYAVAITLVGAVLGWVRYRSGSIIPGTVLHGAFNTVAVIALVASKFFPTK